MAVRRPVELAVPLAAMSVYPVVGRLKVLQNGVKLPLTKISPEGVREITGREEKSPELAGGIHAVTWAAGM
jgi:hypothetical protein